MRIAITGATGFIGSHVTKSLVSQGHDVIVVGRSEPSDKSCLTFVESNLLDGDNDWISEYKPSHLLHLAWYAEHGKFWSSPLNLNWCDATVKLIDNFCQNGGKRVVVAGSCAEYNWSFGYCKEDLTPSNSSSLYGITKDCARRMSEEICRVNNVSFAWGRVFFPFGVGENSQKLIPSVANSLMGRQPSFSIGIQQWRDVLPVEVVADAFIFLLSQPSSGVFNICSGQPIQLKEIIKKIGVFVNKDPEILLSKGCKPQGSPEFLIGDNTCLTAAGWQPVYDLWESLQVYVNIIAGIH
jgi:nucleoside-diphosphate-sugar epimerase